MSNFAEFYFAQRKYDNLTIMEKEYIIGIIGLGYVGFPLACLFANKYKVIGYDINSERVRKLNKAEDSTNEVSEDKIKKAFAENLTCTDRIEDLKNCNIYIVTVPTPIDGNRQPDLLPLISASHTVGQVISKNDIVVYESTVYPGVTEEVCIPEIEKTSGMKYNCDFFAGYSPERINPGDKVHTVEKICKITSGSTPEIADIIDSLYNSVLQNGTHKVSSIKVAEAAKIIENTQRDVNIAFMNEIAKIFNAMGIDTTEVIEAASTKWNFINIRPGLVGGHCISVDPYYLIQRAQLSGVLPRVMTEARRINDSMGDYVANQIIKLMNLHDIKVKNSNILLLGFSFKENCPDTRNTKVMSVYHTLSEYTQNITIVDPHVNTENVRKEYGINVTEKIENISNMKFDAIALCVAHSEFLKINLRNMLSENGVVYDIKGVLDPKDIDGRL